MQRVILATAMLVTVGCGGGSPTAPTHPLGSSSPSSACDCELRRHMAGTHACWM